MCFQAQDRKRPFSQEAPCGVCFQRMSPFSFSEACSVQHGGGGGGGGACEWLPLELCEAGPWRYSFYISHDAFLEVFRGRTVTSALGVFPSPAEVQSPHLFRGGFSFWFLLPLLTDGHFQEGTDNLSLRLRFFALGHVNNSGRWKYFKASEKRVSQMYLQIRGHILWKLLLHKIQKQPLLDKNL